MSYFLSLSSPSGDVCDLCNVVTSICYWENTQKGKIKISSKSENVVIIDRVLTYDVESEHIGYIVGLSINQSIDQSKHIYISPYVASQSACYDNFIAFSGVKEPN